MVLFQTYYNIYQYYVENIATSYIFFSFFIFFIIYPKLIHFMNFMFAYWRPYINIKKRYGADKPNNRTYALVSGAGTGIGLEIVCKLLMENINVIATSLPRDKNDFNKTVKCLIKENNLTSQVHFIGIDIIAKGAVSSASDLLEKLDAFFNANSIDLQILINCVGISNDYPKKFMDHEMKEIENLLNINLNFTVVLTNLILKKYFDYDKQCGVVFVSSQAGALPGSPLVPIYGCCKAALIHLGKTIKAEDEFSNTKKPIDVLIAIPGYVNSGKTPIWTNTKNGFGIASPRFIAHSILGNLGYNSPIVFSPYIVHGIQFAILDSWLSDYIIQMLSWNELKHSRKKIK